MQAASHPPTSPNPVVEEDAACSVCGGALKGVPLRGTCPGCDVAVRRALLPVVDEDIACNGCGYNLMGLAPSGQCPECGQPVRRSLQGHLLRYSSPGYLESLHKGVVLVQTGTMLQLLVICGGVLLIGIMRWTGVPFLRGIEHMIDLAAVGVSLVSLAGWLKLSVPDPALSQVESGASARAVVRASAVICVVTSALSPALGMATFAFGVQVAELASVAVWLVWYFAAMKYLRWLTPRIPNQKAHDRAKRLMWLGPVLCLVLCVIGGLVALVLYYHLLDWIRKDLRQIRMAQVVTG